MYTDSLVDHFVDLAGPSYDWSGATGGGRFSSSRQGVRKFRDIVRAMLHDLQGGVCPMCGGTMNRDNLPTDGEFNHGVSQGPGKRGYFPGNVFLGHPACNTRAEREVGPVIRPADMVRPDVVATEWIPFPVLLAAHR